MYIKQFPSQPKAKTFRQLSKQYVQLEEQPKNQPKKDVKATQVRDENSSDTLYITEVDQFQSHCLISYIENMLSDTSVFMTLNKAIT